MPIIRFHYLYLNVHYVLDILISRFLTYIELSNILFKYIMIVVKQLAYFYISTHTHKASSNKDITVSEG
jgi:type II secretory pathway component PulC